MVLLGFGIYLMSIMYVESVFSLKMLYPLEEIPCPKQPEKYINYIHSYNFGTMNYKLNLEEYNTGIVEI